MTRKGLEVEIYLQKVNLKKMKIQRINEEDSNEFASDYHSNLLIIASKIDTTTLPPQMKLLWNAQMKQLSAKSSKGYKCNPR